VVPNTGAGILVKLAYLASKDWIALFAPSDSDPHADPDILPLEMAIIDLKSAMFIADKEVIQTCKKHVNHFVYLKNGNLKPFKKLDHGWETNPVIGVRSLGKGYWQGLKKRLDGTDDNTEVLSRSWIEENCDPPFIRRVDRNPTVWFRIDIGSVVDKFPIGVEKLYDLAFTVHFRQGHRPLCLPCSLASAMHYFDKSNVDAGRMIALFEEFREQGVGSDLDFLVEIFLKVYGRRYKLVRVKNFRYLNPVATPLTAILCGKDGHRFHAVTIWKELIFDSNFPSPLHLCKEALDVCCDSQFQVKRI